MHSDPDPSCPPQDSTQKTAANSTPISDSISSTTVLFAAGTSSLALPPFPETSTTAAVTSATTNAAYNTSYTSFNTTIPAPSHKRGREPSAMTDPSEAARYTPPREMFKQSSTNIDLDDLLTQPSEDGLQDGDSDSGTYSNNNNINDQGTQVDGFQGDSEIDNLGRQLSINSPEKTTSTAIDNEQDLVVSDDGQQQEDKSNENNDQQEEQQQPKESNLDQRSLNQQEIPPFDQQSNIIKDLRYKNLVEGDPWYLLNSTWFLEFRKYCLAKGSGRETEPLGPIDNSILLSGNNLRPDVDRSVVTLPEEGWKLLVAWYGTLLPPIIRRVVNTGTETAPNCMIEFYPPVFTLYRVVDSTQAENPLFATNEPEILEASKTTKFGELKSALISRLEVRAPESSRVWAISSHDNVNFLGNVIGASDLLSSQATCLDQIEDDTPIGEVQELNKGSDLALEVAVNGKFPVVHVSMPSGYGSSNISTYPNNYLGPHGNNFASSFASSSFASSQGPPVNGLCGLSNLGNTCFMNSALQCLSNSKDLTQYILAGAWRDELNLDNPLGMGGEVARAYANLIDKLWRGTSKVFSPREFKSTIGRFAPSFTGYHQHDSQELLAFLLDGLHEDLNRIIKKPYTEVPDSNGRPDDEVASDCWNIHKARNDSIIVDLFQGQYKSTLVCPKCSKVSVTFDPFMYLSLPLPINKKWIGTITYVPYDTKKPVVDIRLQLPKGSTQKQLKEKIAELMGTQASHLFSAEVFSSRFYKSHDNADAVDELSETDKNFVYEVPVSDFTNATDHVVFPVHNLLDPVASYGHTQAFGHPMMVCVTKEEASDPDAVYKAIVEQASRYTTYNLYRENSVAPEQEIESTEQDTDVAMSPSQDAEEKLPRGGLFRMLVFSPPPPQVSRYQFRQRATLYAPTSNPSMNEMVDMYQRVAPVEQEVDQEMMILKPQGRNRRSLNGDDDVDNNEPDTILRPSPDSSSDISSPSSPLSQPRMPKLDDDEISEDDDPATLPSSSSRYQNQRHVSPAVPERVAEPAIRQGEMVYCFWDRSLETSISSDKRYRSYSYRSMDQDDEQDLGERTLWDKRGPKVIDPALEEELAAAGGKGKKVITLEDCLNEYTKEEQLGEEDPWYCPSCKEHQQATKKLDIWRLPDVLVVHLKRFSHTRAWRDKIDALVDFPIFGLDLSAKTLKEEDREENVYDLFGVSNHMGGLGGGHYTAYAKNDKLNQWFNFDDSHVSPVSNVESVKTSSAYLLFYRRRNAVVREYEEKTVLEPEPESSSSSSPNFHRNFMEPTTIVMSDKNADDDSEYGAWGRPPIVPYGDLGPDEDDDQPPLYSPLMGSSGMESPPSFSGESQYISEKGYGKTRALDDDDDLDSPLSANMSGYLGSGVGQGGHSPDLSTCASDGSNTANMSPLLSPPTLSSSVVDMTPNDDLSSIGPSYLSKISHEGGRIDDDEVEEVTMSVREGGTGIPTPGSTMYNVDPSNPEAGFEIIDDDEVQDGVNLVEWQVIRQANDSEKALK